MTRSNGNAERARRYRALVQRDGETCALCGTPDDLTVDHIVPKSRGGRDAIVNLQLLCQRCNHAKADSVDPADATPERLRIAFRLLPPTPQLKRQPTRARWVTSTRGRLLLHDARCDASYCIDTCEVLLERRSG